MTCPACNDPNGYVGAFLVSCLNKNCIHFDPAGGLNGDAKVVAKSQDDNCSDFFLPKYWRADDGVWVFAVENGDDERKFETSYRWFRNNLKNDDQPDSEGFFPHQWEEFFDAHASNTGYINKKQFIARIQGLLDEGFEIIEQEED